MKKDLSFIGMTRRKYHGKDMLVNRMDTTKTFSEHVVWFLDLMIGNKKEEKDAFWNVIPKKVFQFV